MTRTCAPRTQRFGAWLIDSALVFLLWYLCTGSDLETVNVLMQTLDPTQPGALDQFAQAIFKMLTAFGLKAAFCQTAYYCLGPGPVGTWKNNRQTAAASACGRCGGTQGRCRHLVWSCGNLWAEPS